MKSKNKERLTNFEKAVIRGENRFANISGEFLTYGIYLSCQAKTVYMAIMCHNFNQEYGSIYPSLSTLSRLSSLSKTSVLASVEELEYFGWIKKISGNYISDNSKKNNTYEIIHPTDGNGKNIYSPKSSEERSDFKKSQSFKRRGNKTFEESIS